MGAPPSLNSYTALFITVGLPSGGSHYSFQRDRLYQASSNLSVNVRRKYSNNPLPEPFFVNEDDDSKIKLDKQRA